MKQLLDVCEGAIIVGLNDCAFVVRDAAICELLAPPPEQSPSNGASTAKLLPNDNNDKATKQKHETNITNPNEIQAVAIASFSDNNQVWCAVSRYNKTLSIYRIATRETLSASISPMTVHKTVKRVLCLAFASIPSENSSSPPLHVAISGDLIGDATAHSLSDASRSRVLLGHTASMLTGLNVANHHHLLTCDRDEKIRVSSFPQTFVIEGYLLGHEAFITSMDVARHFCVSCSGDATVRLWNYKDYQELGRFHTTRGLATRVAISPSANHVVVLYNQCRTVDVLRTNSGTCLELLTSFECKSQPLSVKFVSDECMLVLTGEPEYMVEVKLDKKSSTLVNDSPTVLAIRQVACSRNIVMPTSILETDERTGQLKLEKEAESRGAKADVLPWMKSDRVQTAKEASKRRDKRRRKNDD
jgi:tRNA (guanine-N(7)-)-methyltransferase subunit TRM82